jgi:putative endonuclease
VYLLRLRSGRIYVGVTADPRTRWRDHLAGRACHTTRLDPPTSLLHLERQPSFAAARAREAQLKGWSKEKKLAWARGDLRALHTLAVRRRRRGPPRR